MLNVSDIHTHHQVHDALVCRSPQEPLQPGYSYSVGYHPWDIEESVMPDMEMLERVASQPDVLAIGEVGLDGMRGASLDFQEEVLIKEVELSERLQKPVIIHCVKAYDRLLRLHNQLRPRQLWIVHGFRGKPELARQLTDKGIAISLGEKFNPATVAAIPPHLLYYETDESALPIEEIRRRIEESRANF